MATAGSGYRSSASGALNRAGMGSSGLYGLADNSAGMYRRNAAMAQPAMSNYASLLGRGLTDTDRSAYINNQLGDYNKAFTEGQAALVGRNPDGGADSYSSGLNAAYSAAKAAAVGGAANNWNNYAKNYQMNSANQLYGLYNNAAQQDLNQAQQGYGQAAGLDLSQASQFNGMAQQADAEEEQRRNQLMQAIFGGASVLGQYGLPLMFPAKPKVS